MFRLELLLFFVARADRASFVLLTTYTRDFRWHLHSDCHMSYFMVPLSILGLALPWHALAESVGTSDLVWQVP